MKAAKEFIQAIAESQKKATQPYETVGKVSRIEGKTAWIRLKGASRDTPVKMTISCRKGETVRVRVAGGNAYIIGNHSAPPTDDAQANLALMTARNNAGDIAKLREKLDGDIRDIEDDIENLVGVDHVEIEYILHNSRTNPPSEDAQGWSTVLPEFEEGKYYWTRTATYYTDGTVEYSDPVLYLAGQVAAEAAIAADDAQDAADEAKGIADQNALDIGEINTNLETVEGAIEEVQELAEDTNAHFWADSNGVHISNTEGTISGSGVNAQSLGSTGTLIIRDGKIVTSYTTSAVQFYDGLVAPTSNVLANHLMVSYSRDGILMNTFNSTNQRTYRALQMTPSQLVFWDPSDTTNNGTDSQRKRAVFGANGAELYDGTGSKGLGVSSSGIVMLHDGKMLTSWTKGSLNFYGTETVNGSEVTSLLAGYARSGITHYVQGVRSMSLTDTGLTFWDPSDTSGNGTSSQRMEAIFGSTGAILYAGGNKGLELTAGALKFYNSAGTATLAEFGTTARIGALGGSRFLINASSLQAYNSSNQKYFEVSATGMSFGSEAVAKASDIPTTVAELTDSSDYVQDGDNMSRLTNDLGTPNPNLISNGLFGATLSSSNVPIGWTRENYATVAYDSDTGLATITAASSYYGMYQSVSVLAATDYTVSAEVGAGFQIGFGSGSYPTDTGSWKTLDDNRVFQSQPTPPYSVGDIWTDYVNGTFKICKTARSSGSYLESHWEAIDDASIRVYKTFTTSSAGNYRIYIYGTTSDSATCHVNRIKVEKGSTWTEWSDANDRYITKISGYNGISVHDINDTSNFVNLNSDGLYVYKGGVAYSHFGATSWIKAANTDNRLYLDGNGIGIDIGDSIAAIRMYGSGISDLNSYSASIDFGVDKTDGPGEGIGYINFIGSGGLYNTSAGLEFGHYRGAKIRCGTDNSGNPKAYISGGICPGDGSYSDAANPIGTVLYQGTTSGISASNIDSYTTGTNVELPELSVTSTWVFVGRWDFNTVNTGTDPHNMGVALSKTNAATDSNVIAIKRILAPAGNWASLQISHIYQHAAGTTQKIYLKAASNYANASTGTVQLRAVRIA